MPRNLARDRSRTLIALLVTLTVAAVTLVVLFGNIVGDMRERMRIANTLDKAEIRTPMNGVIGMLELLQQSARVRLKPPIIGRCNNITRHRF
jgi:signal transduction histidine kinase